MQIQKTKFRAGQTKTTLFSATTRCKTKLLFVRTCDKLQSTILCPSPLVAVCKETFFFVTTNCKTKLLCVKTCNKLQNAVFCPSPLVAVFKETFFPLLPIAKQSCFCNKPATSCNKLQNAVFCTSPLVTVANIFTSVVCVRLVVIFTDAKLCLPNLPKRNSSRQG